MTVRLSGESGKVDLLLTKEAAGVHWTELGQGLQGNNSFKLHKERGMQNSLPLLLTSSLIKPNADSHTMHKTYCVPAHSCIPIPSFKSALTLMHLIDSIYLPSALF